MFRSPNAGKLLTTLQRHPDMSITSLAEAVGINKFAMQKLLKSMTSKGYIIRNDADNTWHVLAISTE